MEEKFNNSQEERQFQQFQEYQKRQEEEKKKKRKKGWLFGCGGCLVLLILIIVGVTACTGTFVNEVDKEINEEGKLDKDKDTKIKSIGETTEIDGVSFTLDKTVKNNSKEEIPVGGDIKVYVDGKQAKSYPIDNQLIDSLSPNREISGSEGFAINGNPKKIELEFQPLTSFSNKRYIYNIKPE